MGKSLPRTVLEATLAGWQNIEIKCVCGRDHVVPLAAVSPHGPDLVTIARRFRCKTCGAAPASVRLHRRLVTITGRIEVFTDPAAGGVDASSPGAAPAGAAPAAGAALAAGAAPAGGM